jgi:hypothetical protein
MSTTWTRYGSPISSRATLTFRPFGVLYVCSRSSVATSWRFSAQPVACSTAAKGKQRLTRPGAVCDAAVVGNLVNVRSGDDDTLGRVVATAGRVTRIANVYRNRAEALEDRAWRAQEVKAYEDFLRRSRQPSRITASPRSAARISPGNGLPCLPWDSCAASSSDRRAGRPGTARPAGNPSKMALPKRIDLLSACIAQILLIKFASPCNPHRASRYRRCSPSRPC